MTENKVFQKNIKAEAGRSMVEMLGVLAIIGVLSVGGISGYSKAMAKYKASKAMDQLSLLIANIRTAFATVSSYEDLNNGTAAQYSIVSRDMYAGTGTMSKTSFGLVNAFGGAINLGSYCVGGGTCSSGFTIAYAGLNQEACIQLATADWGTGGLNKINIGGGNNDFTVEAMPISLSDAYAKCTGNSTTITWYFY